MEYKYELHCHTDEVSRCGQVPVEKLIGHYYNLGYSGLVLTDHYSDMTFACAKILSPRKNAEFYLSAYKKALEICPEDFKVFLGMELRYHLTINDYLVYGVSEELIKNMHGPMMMYPKKFIKYARSHGLLVIQAHPFRKYMTRCNPLWLDGAEVYNGKDDEKTNGLALEWANQNGLKIQTGGADFHRISQKPSGIITTEKIETNEQLVNILRSGRFEIIKDVTT